jgi:hypothetical protein
VGHGDGTVLRPQDHVRAVLPVTECGELTEARHPHDLAVALEHEEVALLDVISFVRAVAVHFDRPAQLALDPPAWARAR